MSLNDALEDVSEFHIAIGAAVTLYPRMLEADSSRAEQVAQAVRACCVLCRNLINHGDDLFARAAMELEEMAEWLEAHAQRDLEAAADAWGDRLYVLLGDAVAAGLPADKIFGEVHRSNMTKVPHLRAKDGKAIKGDAFRRPYLDGPGNLGAPVFSQEELEAASKKRRPWRVRIYQPVLVLDEQSTATQEDDTFNLPLAQIADELVVAEEERLAASQVLFKVAGNFLVTPRGDWPLPTRSIDIFECPESLVTHLKAVSLMHFNYMLETPLQSWLIAVEQYEPGSSDGQVA
ncbi:pyrophosphohydrolase domain-containing protein [Botrimarina hoheduenensis]|uniref:Phosphoribosyl-ATP pyrophosphohydrolase n=1 Tax=Botrimarina hoheduenensis TaxID=2528000 RepID=A0A5C5VQ24_9BACT|nr:nucleoside triphosphate pyrophosphohydrolase family protein [Botrimarina hoheduenensis]TWT40220.1 Phosphoribosyl-ATP pyrophosphohydrolase [Botrimarina hoheduenensis]